MKCTDSQTVASLGWGWGGFQLDVNIALEYEIGDMLHVNRPLRQAGGHCLVSLRPLWV